MRFALDSRIYNLYLLINIDDKKEPQNGHDRSWDLDCYLYLLLNNFFVSIGVTIAVINDTANICAVALVT